MTGFELLKAPNTTAGEIADIISEHCPPVCPAECDRLACRECWFSWLTTGEPPKAAGPSDRQTAPDEEGLHPNLAERLKQQKQGCKEQFTANMIVSNVYEAIILSKGSEIPAEQRLDLLESLQRTYCERNMGRKLGIAHHAALNKIGGLFVFEDSE